MKINIRFWSHLAHCFLERQMFQTNLAEKIKTQILRYEICCRKLCSLKESVEKKVKSPVYDCSVKDVEYICNKFSCKYIFNSTVVDWTCYFFVYLALLLLRVLSFVVVCSSAILLCTVRCYGYAFCHVIGRIFATRWRHITPFYICLYETLDVFYIKITCFR
jgi:hypothetical protein